MSRNLGDAYISILPNTANFRRLAKEAIKKALLGVEGNVGLGVNSKALGAEARAAVEKATREAGVIKIRTDADTSGVRKAGDAVLAQQNRIAKARDADAKNELRQRADITKMFTGMFDTIDKREAATEKIRQGNLANLTKTLNDQVKLDERANAARLKQIDAASRAQEKAEAAANKTAQKNLASLTKALNDRMRLDEKAAAARLKQEDSVSRAQDRSFASYGKNLLATGRLEEQRFKNDQAHAAALGRALNQRANIKVGLDDKGVETKAKSLWARIHAIFGRDIKQGVDLNDGGVKARANALRVALRTIFGKDVKQGVDLNDGGVKARATGLRVVLSAIFSKDVRQGVNLDDGGVKSRAAGLRAALGVIFGRPIKQDVNIDRDRISRAAGGIFRSLTGLAARAGGAMGGAFSDSAKNTIGKGLNRNPGIAALVIVAFAALPAAVGVLGAAIGVGLGVAIIGAATATLIKDQNKLTKILATIRKKTGDPNAGLDRGTPAQQVQGEILQKQIKMLQQFQATANRARSVWEQLKSSMFSAVADSGFLKAANAALSSFQKSLKTLGPLFTSLFAASAPLIQPFVDFFTLLIQNLLPGLTSLLSLAGGQIGIIIQTLGSDIGFQLARMFQAAIPFIQASGTYLHGIVGVLGDLGVAAIKFGGFLAQVFDSLAPVIKVLAGHLADVFTVLGNVLKSLAPAIALVVKIFAQLAALFTTTLVQAISLLLPPLIKLATVVLAAIAKILPVIIRVLQPLIKFFAQLAALLTTALVKAVTLLLPPLIRLVTVVLAAIAKVLPVILPLLLKFAKLFTAALVIIVAKLADALAQMVTAITPLLPQLTTLVTTVLQTLVSLLPVILPLLVGFAGVFTTVLVGLVQGVAAGLTGILKATPPGLIQAIVVAFVAWKGAMLLLGGAMKLYAIATDIARVATLLFEATNPIGWIALAVAAFVTAAILIVLNWNKILAFFKKFWPLLLIIFLPGIGLIVVLIVKNWSHIAAVTVSIWNGIKAAVSAVWNWLKGAASAVWGFLKAVIPAAWNNIKANSIAVWNGIKGALSAAWNWIKGAAGAVWGFLKAVIPAAWNAIKGATIAVWNAVKGALSAVWNWIKGAAGAVWGFLRVAIPAAWNAIKGATIAVWNAVKGALSAVWNWIKSAASVVWSALRNTIITVWNVIKGASIAVWNAIKGALSTIWNWAKAAASAVWSALRNTIVTVWNVIKGASIAVWNAIKGALSTIWNWAKAAASAVWSALRNTIITVWNAIKGASIAVWNAIKGALSTVWNWAKGAASTVWSAMRNTIITVWNAIKGATLAVWDWIKSKLTTVWNWMKGAARLVWGILLHVISDYWNKIKSITGAVWDWIKSKLSTVWNWMKGAASLVWGILLHVISDYWNKIKSITGAVWDWIKSKLSQIWENMKGLVRKAADWIHDTVVGVWEKIKARTRDAWQWIVNTVKNVWNEIKKIVAVPINIVIGFINTMTDGVNAVLSTIGIHGKGGGPKIGHITPIPGYAAGGKVTAGTHDTADDVLIRVSRNETILSAQHSRMLAPTLGDLGVPGFAKGGKIPGFAKGGTPDLSMYRNPLARANYGLSRIDQGVDFTGPGPVLAIGAGDVLHVATGNTGWGPPAGPAPGLFMTYRLAAGPAAGSVVYVAEGASPNVKAGDHVKAGQLIATMNGSSIETGFANSAGTGALSQTAAAASGNWQNSPGGTAVGQLFEDLLMALGVRRAPNQGHPAAGKIPGDTGGPGWLAGLAALAKNAGGLVINAIGDLLGLNLPGPLKKAIKSLLDMKAPSGKQMGQGWVGDLTSGVGKFGAEQVGGWLKGKAFDALKKVPFISKLIDAASAANAPPGTGGGDSDANGLAVINYLQKNLFGGSRVAAAGAAASMWGESSPPGWNPESRGTGGFGLIGWSSNTLGLPSGYKPNGDVKRDMAIQLPGIIGFVKASGDMGAIAEMIKAKSVAAAANIWGPKVERFGVNDVHPEGIAAATKLAGLAAGGKITQGTSDTADDVLIRVSKNETVLSAAHSRQLAPVLGQVGVPGYAKGGRVDIFGASNARRLAPYIHHPHVNSGIEGNRAVRDNARFARAIAGTDAALLWEGYNDIAAGTSASAVAGANAAKITAAHKMGVPVVLGSLQSGTIASPGRRAQITEYNRWAAGAADAYTAIGATIPRGQVHGDALAYTVIARSVDARFDTVLKRAATAKAKAAKGAAAVKGKGAAAVAAAAAAVAARAARADDARVLALGRGHSRAGLQGLVTHFTRKLNADAKRGDANDYAGTAAALADVNLALTRYASPAAAEHDAQAAFAKTALANAKAAQARGDKRGFMIWNQKYLADAAKVTALNKKVNTPAGAAPPVLTSLTPVQRLAYTLGTKDAKTWDAVAYQLRNHSLNPTATGKLSKADMSSLALNVTPGVLDVLYGGPGASGANWQALATALTGDLFNHSGIYGAGSGKALALLGKLTGQHGQYSGKRFAQGGWINEPVSGIGLKSGMPYSFGENGRREKVIPEAQVGGRGNTDALLAEVLRELRAGNQIAAAAANSNDKALGGTGRLFR